MSKKFWTLRPTHYFTKPLPNGSRNEIAWAFVGTIVVYSHRMRSPVLGKYS